jgi:hypothetical protein
MSDKMFNFPSNVFSARLEVLIVAKHAISFEV